jgi:hypothetical protein
LTQGKASNNAHSQAHGRCLAHRRQGLETTDERPANDVDSETPDGTDLEPGALSPAPPSNQETSAGGAPFSLEVRWHIVPKNAAYKALLGVLFGPKEEAS